MILVSPHRQLQLYYYTHYHISERNVSKPIVSETYICPNCHVATNGARQTKRITDISNLPSPARSGSSDAQVDDKVVTGKAKPPAKRGRKRATEGVAAEQVTDPAKKRKTKAGRKKGQPQDEEEDHATPAAMMIDTEGNGEEQEEEDRRFKSDPESNDEASESDSDAEGSNYGDELQEKMTGSRTRGHRANGKPEPGEESESQSENNEVRLYLYT
jgi:hypothetical protein